MSTATPVKTPVAPTHPVVTRNPWVVWLLVATCCTLLLLPATITSVALGADPYEQIFVRFPGTDVAVSTAIGHGVALASSTVTVGALVSLLFFRDARGKNSVALRDSLEMSILLRSAGLWGAASGAMVFFDMLDSSGMPFQRITEPGAFAFLFEASAFPAAWTLSFVAALVTVASATFATRWTGLLPAAWASGFGILAPVVVGQVLVGPDHDFAGDAAVIQTLLIQGLFGALIVVAIRSATGRLVPPGPGLRLLKTMLFGLPVIILADLLLAWFKLAGTGLFASITGWQIIAGWACLLVVVLTVLVTLVAGRRSALTDHGITIALSVSAVAMFAWMGVSTAMTRVPPPSYFQPTSISQIFMGFEVPEAPTALVLFTAWRPNILFVAIAVLAVCVYLFAVLSMRRRGDHWPFGRTIAWVLGWAVVVFATSSGFGKYSAPDFGIHMIVHMSLNMLAPILLVMGGIITLLLRAIPASRGEIAGPHEWITWLLHWRGLNFLYNPLLVFALFVGSYYGLYFTGIFGEYMRFHWAHQLMNLHFLIAGYLFYGLVIGVDRPPRPLPHIGKLGFVLAAMPFHAFFGVILMSMPTIIAENFYRYLDLPWADLRASQYMGGGVAWAGGELPLLLVIISLSIQWSRQDAREAKRKDRHFDTGRDDEFEAYNRMLQRLTDRQAGQLSSQQLKTDKNQETRK
ncbi:cytochrome c oxidase assembly protein [Pseudoclavibacter sp. RFBJ3]|uniref:cytochrome c oxidase assembly protein n=1 Tax=unclassified Pseudoclavibacter TaxID=2615177 RepID=UPI000CE84DD3|nr:MULTISPECIES: cytochrome c oxidase assembly protein [unclassified Pseudoclavibacter]PPF87542.1 cytochrome c oxidase assembly protein [Pseudoclavibacter sp. RFBJ5]PPF90392.1 cytochrome c oxidase assembly protein [Pseudoclavibacter sp. RFBJ3]PPG01077.1 cytochrome c oxidase assembly protein [Pseudoclavibacter sp. RFBH5]PPG26180.1 cytochrome c oxidase assembly protein [Pseudoclavibacter sp. RFBI4]